MKKVISKPAILRINPTFEWRERVCSLPRDIRAKIMPREPQMTER